MPRLRVRASSSLFEKDFHIVPVNQDTGFAIQNPHFTGRILVRLQNFTAQHRHPAHDLPSSYAYLSGQDEDGQADEDTSHTAAHVTPSSCAYFDTLKRLYSIQIEGEFHHPINGDELVLACDFDKPLKHLPFGISVAVGVARLIDPGLTVSLFQERPSLSSPVLCAVNVMQTQGAHASGPHQRPSPTITSTESSASSSGTSPINEPIHECFEEFSHSAYRRKHFLSESNRKAYTFMPGQRYRMDWFSPYIDWNTFEVAIGMRLKAAKYLDGQPVRFTIRDRTKRVVICVVEFALVD